jgi:outer membrane biosynthesis protein TonB
VQNFLNFYGKRYTSAHTKYMKKLILLSLPLFLAACMHTWSNTDTGVTVKTDEQIAIKPEDKAPVQPTPDTKKPAPTKPTTKTNPEKKPDTSTDEMTEELDKLIDDIIGG